jgi:geranylgeranyl pyrophosphate synthase
MELTAVTFFDLVREDLQAVEAQLRTTIPAQPEAVSVAVARLINAGGKRLRPVLALLAGRVFECDLEKAVCVAAAVETLHTATLVHDDLVDGSLLRRGMRTLNSQWSPSVTVLTGDYLFARAAAFAAQTDSIAVVREFSNTLQVIIGGEINQMFAGRGQASREAYLDRIYAKTAVLFALSAHTPALLSCGNEAMGDALRTYGREMGMAFQIMDDILDFTSDEAKLGKPVGSDLRQGLFTLPALCYLESHPDDTDMAALLKGSRNARMLARVTQAIRQSSAIDAARQEAEAYVARAQAALAVVPDNAYRRALTDMADYVIRRDL